MLKTIDILARAKELIGKKFKCTKSLIDRDLVGEVVEIELFGNGQELYYGLKRNNHKVPDLTGFEEWEEVQEPISFMEAIKAHREGKYIYCLLGNTRYTYNPDSVGCLTTLCDQLGDGLSSEEILDGKWYIKEEDEK